MHTLHIGSRANQATTLPALLVAYYANNSDRTSKITITIEDVDKLQHGTSIALEDEAGKLETASPSVIAALIHGTSRLQSKSQKLVDEWLARLPNLEPPGYRDVEPQLIELDSHLLMRSHIVGYEISVADLAIYGAIRGNRAARGGLTKGNMVNLLRWFKYMEEAYPWIGVACQSLNAAAQEKKAAASKKGASYDIELKDTDKGVVTRFPPEPSGYLHIGHAKAALLNDYFAHEAYPGGKLICRFDDTNPAKEREEYQEAIVKDLALMGIKPDVTTYSSDYFQEMYEACVRLLSEGKAYADDTDKEAMAVARKNKTASKRRDASVEDNLAAFEKMKQGSEEGLRWCIRAKIAFDDNNGAMRDPVIYRCNLTPHHRTGSAWKMYPTYDFCVPFVDAHEGVTHALRTIEYRDRNPQYEWMQKALGLRPVYIWDFARMNFIRTLLSKRKLAKFVESGLVWGWDDPRFPTVRGIRRRGMTIGALREFILKQGPSRNVVNLDWTAFWTTNKKYIDPVAPRHTAISKVDLVACKVNGAQGKYAEDKPKHGKNPDLGTKKVYFAPTIMLEQEDAKTFAQDEEITLMGWGNAIVRRITKSHHPMHLSTVTSLDLDLNLQGDVKTTSKKVTWLADEGQNVIPVELVDFDFLITKDSIEPEDNVEDFINPKTETRVEALADQNVEELKEDDIIQFERKGFFRVDKAYKSGQSMVLFQIPTGKEENLASSRKGQRGGK